MKKSLGLLPKILSGEKTIESRWYQTRRAPWDRIAVDDTVWLKNSGESVTVRARVKQVRQFADLTPEKVEDLVNLYGPAIGITVEGRTDFLSWVKDKRYCILIWLERPEPVEPFEVDKAGYGLMSAWVAVRDIVELKR
ncbi:MAG: ASCH domain-containing protein [bacterium]